MSDWEYVIVYALGAVALVGFILFGVHLASSCADNVRWWCFFL